MKKTVIALGALLLAGSAAAKLPPLSDEAKMKADEAKAKAAWGDKVAAYKLCQSQDKVAAQYLKAKGAKAAATAAPCQDPGAFVAPTAAAAPTGAMMAAAAPAKPAAPAASSAPATK
jgi:hypothetical protein